MRDIYFAVIFFGLLFPIGGNAQVTKKKVQPKATNTSASTKKPRCPGYEFRVKIGADGNSHLYVLTGLESQDLDNTLLKKVLEECMAVQTPEAGRIPAGPRVIVDPDPNLDFRTVAKVIWAVRASGPNSVLVAIPDGPFLKVPPEPKYSQLVMIKPDPLTLIVALTKENGITLNNEEYGSLADPLKMTERLKKIFTQREDNGVFREGSYEVEKTVFVKIPLTASFADLIKISRALQIAGAEPIGLQVDDLQDWIVDKRKELIKIP